ncbi:acyl-CoA reductase [Streptomyces mirabilis]|uniref:acyl-CoA reductase n=1 Tax=Streptomyces mirabilis TaxID=68239 RepID=UPI0033A75B21
MTLLLVGVAHDTEGREARRCARDHTEDKAELRDRLVGAGVQRVVKLGSALSGSIGNPHDAMYPLHRFVNWVVDDDA